MDSQGVHWEFDLTLWSLKLLSTRINTGDFSLVFSHFPTRFQLCLLEAEAQSLLTLSPGWAVPRERSGPWPRVPGGLAGCSREGEHGEQEPPWGCAGPCARDRPRCLCWYLRTGSQLQAVLGREHSLLLAEEELSERCPAPCAGIPAILGQKLRCAMTDLQVWHPQLVSAITMLGITWLLHWRMFRWVFDQNRCKTGKNSKSKALSWEGGYQECRNWLKLVLSCSFVLLNFYFPVRGRKRIIDCPIDLGWAQCKVHWEQ